MSSLIGRNLGIYQIRDVIGHGGMASVYLGYRADVDRTVAIKVLPPHPGLNEDAMQRFRLEARTIANLQHPHILPLYDYGATDDGVLYLVMPYVRGGSLDRIVRDGSLSLDKVGRLVREISGALDYAHRQGVIHRDIKPANILLDGEGNALLADFGIVKLTGGDSQLTGTSVVGTPAYMSPEQAQGFELSARADLYSFGIVVYELLTGKLPFSSDSVMNLMLKHITDPVPDLADTAPSLPRTLDAVMKKILAKDVNERFATGAAFNEAFQRAMTVADSGAGIREMATTKMDTPSPSLPPVQAVTTPKQPLQIKLSKNSAPITLPIDPSDPNLPGTIVIQPPLSSNNTPLFIAFGAVALIAVAALVIVLLGLGNRAPESTATQTAATQQADLTPTTAPTAIARVNLEPTFGRASFSSSTDDLLGDSLNIRVEDFAAAPSGKVYVVSLRNTVSGERLSLGRLNVDAVGSGALGYIDPEGRSLPIEYNAVEVTLEANATAPEFSDVRYSSVLPITVSDLIRQLFIESENGFRGRSLLETAQLEARFAAQHTGLAAGASNLAGRRTHNEHTLNILLGGEQDFDGSGRGANPGLGIGLLPALDLIETTIEAVANAPDAPVSVQSETELVRVCLQNVRQWTAEVIVLEQSMLQAEVFEDTDADAQASTSLADRLNSGFDENENGIVDPFEGECGLDQVRTFGLVIASFDLFDGARAGASGE